MQSKDAGDLLHLRQLSRIIKEQFTGQHGRADFGQASRDFKPGILHVASDEVWQLLDQGALDANKPLQTQSPRPSHLTQQQQQQGDEHVDQPGASREAPRSHPAPGVSRPNSSSRTVADWASQDGHHWVHAGLPRDMQEKIGFETSGYEIRHVFDPDAQTVKRVAMPDNFQLSADEAHRREQAATEHYHAHMESVKSMLAQAQVYQNRPAAATSVAASTLRRLSTTAGASSPSLWHPHQQPKACHASRPFSAPFQPVAHARSQQGQPGRPDIASPAARRISPQCHSTPASPGRSASACHAPAAVRRRTNSIQTATGWEHSIIEEGPDECVSVGDLDPDEAAFMENVPPVVVTSPTQTASVSTIILPRPSSACVARPSTAISSRSSGGCAWDAPREDCISLGREQQLRCSADDVMTSSCGPGPTTSTRAQRPMSAMLLTFRSINSCSASSVGANSADATSPHTKRPASAPFRPQLHTRSPVYVTAAEQARLKSSTTAALLTRTVPSRLMQPTVAFMGKMVRPTTTATGSPALSKSVGAAPTDRSVRGTRSSLLGTDRLNSSQSNHRPAHPSQVDQTACLIKAYGLSPGARSARGAKGASSRQQVPATAGKESTGPVVVSLLPARDPGMQDPTPRDPTPFEMDPGMMGQLLGCYGKMC